MRRRYYYRNASGAIQTYTPAEQERYGAGYERTFSHPRSITTTSKRTAQSPAQKRARRREGMFRKLHAKGRTQKSAARAALRAYPFGRGKKGRWHGLSYGRRGGTARRAQPKQYSTVRTHGRRRVTRQVTIRRRVRIAYGRYRRARMRDPMTGRKRLSYMYRDKKGRYRKIPLRAIASVPRGRRRKGTGRGFQEVARAARVGRNVERIKRARSRAAARVLRSGGPFVPNRKQRRKKMRLRRNKSSKRARAARKGWRRRRAARAFRKNAKRYAENPRRRRRPRRWSHKRRTGRGRGRHGVRLVRGRIYYRGRKPRYLRGKRARRLPRGRVLLTNKRRHHRRRRRNAARQLAENPRRRRRHRRHRRNARRNRRHYAANGRRRRRHHRRHYAANARRRHHRHGRRRNRRYTANAFFADLKAVAKSALFVTVGFVGQKAITRLLTEKVVVKALKGPSMAKFAAYLPIFTGIPVTLLGIWASGKVAPRYRTELGGGMIAALIHTTIVTALEASTSTAPYGKYLAGYGGRSTAAAIGRGMRGLGDAQQGSILPRYAALGPKGPVMQAVAGRGTGEYFQVQTSGLGEYFVNGASAVGNYELAGPLVTQAAAGFGQVVEDGIRPDSDLDALLTLAESQAGLGEYYAAKRSDGSVEQYVVPQQSQWVPNGPLWAGTTSADDTTARAELPAGILETPGGNGVFG